MSYFECFSVTLMLWCNLTKSDESTFFIQNVMWVFVQNWVLRYIKLMKTQNAQLSQSSYYIFTFLCLSLTDLVQGKQICKVQ